MATVAVLAHQEQLDTVKRSMTHPLCDPRSNGGKRRVKKGEPFDPEELSKRLSAHLAEQKLKSEKRRAARLAKAIGDEQYGVFVPKVAAAAFHRTTTPDVMRHIHRLSQPALKQQLERLSVDDPTPQITSLQRTQAFDRAVIERDILRNRNQFQWNHDMEEAAEVDIERDVNRAPQRTFKSEFAYLRSRHEKGTERPLSTGDIFSEEDEPPTTTKTKLRSKAAFNGRNDWAQREDGVDSGGKSVKDKSNSFLRKKDSIWMLKSRKEKRGKQEDNDTVEVFGDSRSPSDGSKSARSSFLGRFKRHPS